MNFLKKLFAMILRRRPHITLSNPLPPKPAPVRGVLGIVIGHTSKDGGAVGVAPVSVSEYKFNTALAKLIHDYAKADGVAVRIYDRNAGLTAAYQRAEKDGCLAVIELHFNSAGPTAYGTETLHGTSNADSREWAAMVQRHMCQALDRYENGGNRGLVSAPPHPRGRANVNALATAPSCLIEPAFAGSNPSEARLLFTRQHHLARALVAAFREWAA